MSSTQAMRRRSIGAETRQACGDVPDAAVQQYADAADVNLGLFVVQRIAALDRLVALVNQAGQRRDGIARIRRQVGELRVTADRVFAFSI